MFWDEWTEASKAWAMAESAAPCVRRPRPQSPVPVAVLPLTSGSSALWCSVKAGVHSKENLHEQQVDGLFQYHKVVTPIPSAT